MLSYQSVWQGLTEDDGLEIVVNLLRRPLSWPAPFWEVLRSDAGGAVGRLAGAGVLHAEGAGGAGVGGEAPGSTPGWLCQHIAEGLLWHRSVFYPIAVWILLKTSKLRRPIQRCSCKQGSLATPESELFFQPGPSSRDLGGHAWDAHCCQPPPPPLCYPVPL